MPSKRSRFKEREKKKRANRTLEKRKADNAADRERKRRQKSTVNHQEVAEELRSPEEIDNSCKLGLEQAKADIEQWKREYEEQKNTAKNKKKIETRKRVKSIDKERKRREREEIKKDINKWEIVCSADR